MLLFGASRPAQGSDQPLPFLRLTVLGSSDSGKTSLINSWVNNTCPSAYVPTDQATLYYRSMRIENPLAQADEDGVENLVNVLVEVEDTPGWSSRPGEAPPGKRFLDTAPQRPVQRSGLQPPQLALADFPRPERKKYAPLSRCRMAFLVVFDSNRPESWETAKEIVDELHRPYADREGARKDENPPMVVLVANKIDKEPFSATFRSVLEAARRHARVVEVSAVEFTRVRKLFRDLVEELVLRPQLWSEDGQGVKQPEVEKSTMHQIGNVTQDCSLQ